MRDFAVLYRTNAVAQHRACAQTPLHSVPHFRRHALFDRTEVKDILAYLSVIANPTDETRLRALERAPRGIGATSLEKIREIAAAENISVLKR